MSTSKLIRAEYIELTVDKETPNVSGMSLCLLPLHVLHRVLQVLLY